MATWKLTPDTGEVTGTHTDMPLVLIPSATEIGAITQAQANSIRCYTDASLTTEIAREIVSADRIDFKIPSASTSMEVYIDFDGVRSDYATNATYGAENVWTDYAGVWHMEEASGTRLDSTANSNDLSENGGTISSGTGKLGNGADINSNKYLNILDASQTGLDLGTNDFTLSVWSKQDTTANMLTAMKGDNGASGVWYGLFSDNSIPRGFRAAIDDGTTAYVADDDTTVSAGTFYKVMMQRSGDNLSQYRDASLGQTVTGVNLVNLNTSQDFRVGISFTSTLPFDGVIDELRVRNDAVSADWETTEYNNQNDNGAFWVATDVTPVSGVKNPLFFGNAL